MQRGVSLTELLLALFLSSVLMLILVNQYVAIKHQYVLNETLMEHTLDVQLLLDLMRDRIHQAGFTPCLGVDHLRTIDGRAEHRSLTAVVLNPKARPGFQVNHMSNRYTEVVNQPSSTRLLVAARPRFSVLHPVLIADCFHAEVHTLRRVDVSTTGQQLELNQPLHFTYSDRTYIGEWQEEAFFLQREKSTLFYRLSHADALSSLVRDLSVTRTFQPGRSMLRVQLLLENQQKLTLDARIRTA